MASASGQKRPRGRRLRRWLGALATLGLLFVAAVALLPRALSSSPGRTWLLGLAGQVLTPGSIEAKTLEFSWFGPTRLTDVVLRDHQGEAVVSAPRATLDRNLRQLLFERPRLGTLEIEHGFLDAERDAQGRVDLIEALRPVLGKNPRTDLRIKLTDGRVRIRDAALLEPIEAEHSSVDLQIAPRPTPLSWRVDLRKSPTAPAREESFLRASGHLNQWAARERKSGDLALEVTGRSWPWKVHHDGVEGSGRLDGGLSARRTGALWTSRGDLSLLELDLRGERLSGDRLRLDRVKGVWDVVQSESGWLVPKLEIASNVLTLHAQGKVAGREGSTTPAEAVAEGKLDLAAIARQLPHFLNIKEGVVLESGSADLKVSSKMDRDTPVIEVSAKISDLRAKDGERPFTLRDPATLSARIVRPPGKAFQVDRLVAETPYLNARALGDLGAGKTALDATIDFGGLQSQLRELIDFGDLKLAGRAQFKGHYEITQNVYRGRLDAALKGIKVAGPGPLELIRDDATVTIDLSGPVQKSGFPGGWTDLKSRWASGPTTAELVATSGDGRGKFSAHFPLSLGELSPVAEASLIARVNGDVVEIESLEISLKPRKDLPDLAALGASARGRYDRSSGALTLKSFGPSGPRGGVGLSNEGLSVVGLNDRRQLRVEGGVVGDLSLLGPWLPEGYRSLRGTWEARASARSGEAGLGVGGNLSIDGLSWASAGGEPGPPVTSVGPITLTFQALAPVDADRIDLSELVVSGRLATVELSGRLLEPRGRRRLEIDGRVLPEWDAISALLAERVEPGATVRGHAHPVKLRADLNDSWRETLDGSLGFSLDGADVFGLKVGPASLVVRAKAGQVGIDPIDVAVNEGRIHLEPAIKLGAEGGSALVLGPSSSIRGVLINDEVSRRVLTFVAPVFDRATRARGRISAEIDEATVPIDRTEGLTAEGSVVFENVEFLPGPFADPLLRLVGRKDRPLFRLDEAVDFSIANRRVYQKGLSIPVGRLTRIGLEGWVDFDRNLDLVASVPIVPEALADRPVLGGIAEAAVVRVPVRGTLKDPQVDREAFNLGIKEMGQSVLEKGITRSIPGLIDLITRPRDPNAPPAPPPLTREERKARQQDRRAVRRRRLGMEP